MSKKETPYAVHCPTHGKVYMTVEEYRSQMSHGDSLWLCPFPIDDEHTCNKVADWDDEQYEKYSS